MLLGPGRLGVLLPTLGGRPIRRRCLRLDQFPFLLGDVLPGKRNQAGIHNLPATGNVTVLGELAVHRLEQRLSGLGGRQTLPKGPERGAVGNLTAVAQPDKTLKAQPIQQLEFHLLVTVASIGPPCVSTMASY